VLDHALWCSGGAPSEVNEGDLAASEIRPQPVVKTTSAAELGDRPFAAPAGVTGAVKRPHFVAQT